MLSGYGANSSSARSINRMNQQTGYAKSLRPWCLGRPGQNQHQTDHQKIANKQKTEPRIVGREH